MQEIMMRGPCPCGEEVGYVTPVNGQDTVRCTSCQTFQYNAPRTETGREVRTVSTTHRGIRPKQRARILLRAGGRCELCGSPGPVQVGHLLSVLDGHAEGLTDQQINSNENLCAQCAECNLGIGSETMPLYLAAAIIRRRTIGDS